MACIGSASPACIGCKTQAMGESMAPTGTLSCMAHGTAWADSDVDDMAKNNVNKNEYMDDMAGMADIVSS